MMEKLLTLNGEAFKHLIESGANHLTNRYQEIDALNVFPVPDGDTGTNMNLTFTAGVSDALKVNSLNISEVAKSFSKGLLMGARGNSGVILSQIFRGFFQGVDGHETIDAKLMAVAFNKGTEIAYKAVMRPVEGTILTVLREGADLSSKRLAKMKDPTILDYMNLLIDEASKSLENTPNLLPVLKDVGVVDSGGAGLLVIFEGMRSALLGQPVTLLETKASSGHVQANLENEEFGYCTEFIVRLSPETLVDFSELALRESLSNLGDSIVVVQDEDIVKVHIHTLTPGDAMNLAQRHGEFVKIKIENMQEQHAAILDDHGSHSHAAPVTTEVKRVPYAIVAVAAGEGLAQAFKDLRVDAIISGGQTMNPSTEDFVAVIEKLNAEHVIVLPNNSNIILAAQQAESIIEDIVVHVLPTKTIPQGLSACLYFSPEYSIEENLEAMNEAIARVTSGSITYAIKDTTINGTEIKANDYMAIKDKDILLSTPQRVDAVKHLLENMVSEANEIVTLIVGEGVDEAERDEVIGFIQAQLNIEVELIEGGQPVYSYLIGVE
jgi:DAK2 domain fusion protein YloV